MVYGLLALEGVEAEVGRGSACRTSPKAVVRCWLGMRIFT